MLLTKRQFDMRIKRGSLPLALIGMSNIGKSFRAGQLEKEKGFQRVSIDDEIGERLGVTGVDGLAHWMGFPFEKRYAAAEAGYLRHEAEAMGGLKISKGKNLVVDTTGSVVYLPQEGLADFRERFLIVHLEVTESMIPEMTDRFFMHPKPVIWGGMFDRRPNESIEVALRRCYPGWLRFRLEKYKGLADLSIPGTTSLGPAVSVDGFIEAIRAQLK